MFNQITFKKHDESVEDNENAYREGLDATIMKFSDEINEKPGATEKAEEISDVFFFVKILTFQWRILK